jgi:succinate dehydrogenase/fumarate reductase flavoprotein subunit
VEHIPALTEGSVETLEWFKTRVGVDLSLVGQLGGHSHARTHRPASGMAGSVLVTSVQKACDAYAESGFFVMKKRARATEIVLGADGAVRGVRWSPVTKTTVSRTNGTDVHDDVTVLNAAVAPAVILATGGFAADGAGADSLLRAHAPASASFATTNTKGTTGDGHKMLFSLGAAAVDMDNVQIHPTGFVDPKDPNKKTKTLAAEILRGAGGLLLTRDGRRFADELGTRDYVSGRMLAEARAEAEAGGEPMHEGLSLEFALVLNEKAAAEAEKHVALYVSKGLLFKLEGVARVASWLKRELGGARVANAAARAHRGKRTVEAALRDTLRAYDAAAAASANGNGTSMVPCPLTNKTNFNGAPFLYRERSSPERLATFSGETFYVGRVTPVTHYTMGGVRVDGDGRVVRNKARAAKTGQSVVPGLFAAGELIGGVHGKNRLGGNALTECAVFGRRAGAAVPLPGLGRDPSKPTDESSSVDVHTKYTIDDDVVSDKEPEDVSLRNEDVASSGEPPDARRATVTRAELAKHASETDCWVALYGEVYDFTDFLEDHPAGAEAITRFAGTDGTKGFDAVHSPGMLEEFEALGTLVD